MEAHDVISTELTPRWELVKYSLEYPKCPHCESDQPVPVFSDAVSKCESCSRNYVITKIENKRIFHTAKEE